MSLRPAAGQSSAMQLVAGGLVVVRVGTDGIGLQQLKACCCWCPSRLQKALAVSIRAPAWSPGYLAVRLNLLAPWLPGSPGSPGQILL